MPCLCFVTKTLNAIGYKWETIQKRRDFAKAAERIGNSGLLANSGVTTIWAGSKREGVTKPLGGDTDVMLVINEMVATETHELFENQSNLTVLQMETIGCPPGYSSLTPVKHGGRWFSNLLTDEMTSVSLQNVIDVSCCVSNHDQVYVSSKIFIDVMSNLSQLGIKSLGNKKIPDSFIYHSMSFQSRAGPSLPISSNNNLIRTSHDNVYSIPCHSPRLFERFRSRRRKHGWPQEHVLQELSQLDAHVVPVGHKRSQHNFQEWRICFTKAEIRLIECLTESQIHVFILLKLFAKFVLKKVWDVMTSYVVINIILWIAELIPTRRFRTDTIVDRFLDCLFFLKMCIKNGNLPNYMISERNLLSHDTFIVKKQKILSVLDDCLREKGSCLLRISTLKESMIRMYSEPELLIRTGLDRDTTEYALLSDQTKLLPELGIHTTSQDLAHYLECVAAYELVELFIGKLNLDEFIRDPEAEAKRVFEIICAHLQ